MRRVDLPVVDKSFQFGNGFRFRWPLPIEIVNGFEWPDVLLRIAVALQAKCHTQRLGMVNHFHLVDLAVALDATDAAVDVGGVIEIDVVRGGVNSDPWDRITGFIASPHGCQCGTVHLDQTVAAHAGVGWWDVGVCSAVDMGVAVAAVHPQLIHVKGMAKGNRLRRSIADAGIFGCEIIGHSSCNRGDYEHNGYDNLDR